jgi:ATP-binding cassette subfamily B (MDR/TAP) protein 1
MTVTSERLTRRLRHMYFEYTLRQDIEYFDQDDHTTGALTSAMSLDPTQVQQLVGTNFGLMLIVLVNLVGGMIVALAYGWKMALVVIFGGVPFIFAGYPVFFALLMCSGVIRMRLLIQFHEKTKKVYEASANFACEATGSIRTVASLTREADVMEIYERSLDAPSHAAFRMAIFSNIWFGLAETIMFLTMALAFWYGSTLVRIGEYGLTQMFTVFIAMIFGSQSAGQVSSFSDYLTLSSFHSRQISQKRDHQPRIY